MCHESRSPHTETNRVNNHGSHPLSELPRTAQTKEMTVSPTPQVTSTTETRSTRRATTAVVTMATTATTKEAIETVSRSLMRSTLSPRALTRHRVFAPGPDREDRVDPLPAVPECQPLGDQGCSSGRARVNCWTSR